MPRTPRSFGPSLYHIGSHGSDDRALFLDDEDFGRFLERLSRVFWHLAIEIVSYVLMTNHYHALVFTPDDRISRALQQVHGGYSFAHNKRHGRTAHLFRAHCFARPVIRESHLLWVVRYFAHNPVEAGLVLDPLDWPWSSARIHAGLVPPPAWLDEHRLRECFGGGDDWRERYRRHIAVNEKGPPEDGPFEVAGAGFEPATSGL